MIPRILWISPGFDLRQVSENHRFNVPSTRDVISPSFWASSVLGPNTSVMPATFGDEDMVSHTISLFIIPGYLAAKTTPLAAPMETPTQA